MAGSGRWPTTPARTGTGPVTRVLRSSANEWGRRDHSEDWGRHRAHSLPNATQMQPETGKFAYQGPFADFDSAIPRFESWRPSQPVRSLRCDFQVWENRRHSRGLAGNGRVFGEENRALPTEGGVFPDESLLHEFSISGI